MLVNAKSKCLHISATRLGTFSGSSEKIILTFLQFSQNFQKNLSRVKVTNAFLRRSFSTGFYRLKNRKNKDKS